MIQDLACRLRANIQTVMVGKDEVIDQVLAQLGVALWLIATVLGAAVLLWMAIRTSRRVRRSFEGGEAETIEPATGPAPRVKERGLCAFLRSAIRLPGRARGLCHALLVRRVYAELLEWAADEAARGSRPRRLLSSGLPSPASCHNSSRIWRRSQRPTCTCGTGKRQRTRKW